MRRRRNRVFIYLPSPASHWSPIHRYPPRTITNRRPTRRPTTTRRRAIACYYRVFARACACVRALVCARVAARACVVRACE